MNYRHEILHLRDQYRWTEKEIARHLDLAPSTVHYWLAKADTPSVPDPPKRGRPRITTLAFDSKILNICQKNPFKSASDIREDLETRVSVDTIRKRLQEQGMKCRIPARKPYLKPEHIRWRLKFAKNHRDWGVSNWEKVVFSDEKIFRASSKGQVRVYRPKRSNRYDKRYLVPSTNRGGRFTICVWMAFGKRFRKLLRVEQKTLNSVYYTQVILSSIRGHLHRKRLTFMQDRSSIHTSGRTKHWFVANNIRWMKNWPAKGPDMNPVENVWAELVRRVASNPTNKDRLWENVQKAFYDIEEDYFDTLIESMPRRMERVCEAKGGWTKY